MPLIVSFIAVGVGFLIWEGVRWLCCLAAKNKYCPGRGIRALWVLAGFVIGGFWVRFGYWLAYEGWIEWKGTTAYVVTYPVNGWVIMVGGGLIAIFSVVASCLFDCSDFLWK